MNHPKSHHSEQSEEPLYWSQRGGLLLKYQLVLQFVAIDLAAYDRLVCFEEDLITHLPAYAEVDGHDSGLGEFNIFILTDYPVETFEAAEALRKSKSSESLSAAAYRELLGEEDVVLWPPGAMAFRLA